MKAFRTVPVTDIYAIIAYYLAHRAELDAYLAVVMQKASVYGRKSKPTIPLSKRHPTSVYVRLIEEKRRERGE